MNEQKSAQSEKTSKRDCIGKGMHKLHLTLRFEPKSRKKQFGFSKKTLL